MHLYKECSSTGQNSEIFRLLQPIFLVTKANNRSVHSPRGIYGSDQGDRTDGYRRVYEPIST